MLCPSPWATCISQTIPVQRHIIRTIIQISSSEGPSPAVTLQHSRMLSTRLENWELLPSSNSHYLCPSGLWIWSTCLVTWGLGTIWEWISKSGIFTECCSPLLWGPGLLFCRCVLFKNVRSLFKEFTDNHFIYLVTRVCKMTLFNQKNVSCPKQIINFLTFILAWIRLKTFQLLKKERKIIHNNLCSLLIKIY